METHRVAYNNWARGAGSGCDSFVDFDAATRDPGNPQRLLPAYDPGDHLHPNDAGLQAMANAVDLNWFGPPGTPVPSGVSLRSRANNLYVTAPANGPLIASKSTVTTAELFERVDLGNGNIALRSKANNLYIAAEAAGTQPLIANRPPSAPGRLSRSSPTRTARSASAPKPTAGTYAPKVAVPRR
ncbi:hypothetical protein [Acrocarpospora sp. B8E8]|uniref:hypothetical protein n=1 Tax=Acrocarpospora sp. B8E8 TaxID=3153572 RepID=UPI00325F109C